MIKIFKKAISILLITLIAIIKLNAQETTSEIQGTVSNQKQVLAGAVVVAIHTPTGTMYKTTTRIDGRYNLANLKIGGPYKVTVTFVGYTSISEEGILLTVGQSYKQNFTLNENVTSLKEIVVKSTNDKNFNSNRNGSQELITRSQLDRLPTINRSIQDFVKLEPTANGLNIGGRSNQYNNMTIDGANFNNSFGLSSLLGGHNLFHWKQSNKFK